MCKAVAVERSTLHCASRLFAARLRSAAAFWLEPGARAHGGACARETRENYETTLGRLGGTSSSPVHAALDWDF